jgi:hypothetical protein
MICWIIYLVSFALASSLNRCKSVFYDDVCRALKPLAYLDCCFLHEYGMVRGVLCGLLFVNVFNFASHTPLSELSGYV